MESIKKKNQSRETGNIIYIDRDGNEVPKMELSAPRENDRRGDSRLPYEIPNTNPSNFSELISAGEYEIGFRHYKDAIEYFREASNILDISNKDYARALVKIAKTYYKMGDSPSAEAYLEKISQYELTEEQEIELARILERHGKFRLAHKHWGSLEEKTTSEDKEYFNNRKIRLSNLLGD